jgi:hypothetical protein
VEQGQLEVGSPVAVRWRAIIRFDKSIQDEVWGEVHRLLTIPLTFDCAARLLTSQSLRIYRQMPEYKNHPEDYLFVGILRHLDKE